MRFLLFSGGHPLRTLGPVASGTQHLLDNVTHGTSPSLELRDVARYLQYLDGRVGRADRHTHLTHTLQIGDVVTHIEYIFGLEVVLGHILP